MIEYTLKIVIKRKKNSIYIPYRPMYVVPTVNSFIPIYSSNNIG